MKARRRGRVILAGTAALVFVNGVSVLFRPLHDRRGATAEELDRALPGDERLPHCDAVTTRAVTIAAPPSAVWPWLLQLGWGRAGWYSHDLIDNRGRASAREILPEHQSLEAGDKVPSGPMGVGFKVLEVAPERYLLLDAGGPGSKGTWVFALEALPGERTRLVERIRGRTEWWSPLRWLSGPADLLDYVMMWRHLHGLKARAEAAWTPGTEPADGVVERAP